MIDAPEIDRQLRQSQEGTATANEETAGRIVQRLVSTNAVSRRTTTR